jgi:hypothetical protein
MTELPQTYPIRLEADYPPESSRPLAFCGIVFLLPKLILLLPHIVVLYFVNIAVFVAVYISYWVVLFTGQYPRGIHEFAVGALRWQVRTSAWFFSLTDQYPPFSLR